ncbi:TPA: hypothetical protein N0F65_003733 [Lagenidium giganteum]|uniref:Enoyl reductase (ER) domain-containing protein n=1 Tax=Lagenidium giganteum TaxID=4803 RepID=A0AAV2Z0A1_9STRA|nr:TPA: hypothetical protein N0F65_003733 [Lagenidium giganteum]
MAPATSSTSFQQIQVHTLSTDFRHATKIIEVPEVPSPSANHVVVKNAYVGINATDINITNGAYGARPLPFSCGLEGVGTVVSIGEGVSNVQVGDYVAYQKLGAFAEYVEVAAATVIKSPELSPSVVPLTVCGISASIALEQVGELRSKETVLVTAAAGGTGQFVVQLAKQAGNHVIGTCSSDEKVEYLKSLGCDRVINYKREDVSSVLKKEYPDGVNLVFETVGGEMFRAAAENLAVHGRIIVFGYISGYKASDREKQTQMVVSELAPRLLSKSASVRGFLLGNHAAHIPAHMKKLLGLVAEKKLSAGVDSTDFVGLSGVADALDHMYAGKNIGKVVVRLS